MTAVSFIISLLLIRDLLLSLQSNFSKCQEKHKMLVKNWFPIKLQTSGKVDLGPGVLHHVKGFTGI